MLKEAGIVAVGLVVLLAIAPVVAPLHLSYVYSDSMEPTIQESDGYVTVPAGDVSSGDIIMFWSPTEDTYVTHRVVGQTEKGYITKGDNNPTADQSAGSPYVNRNDIRGKVLTFRGEPVTIPKLGVGARFINAHWSAIAALLGAGFLIGIFRTNGGTELSRSVPRARDVMLPIFLVALVGTIGFQFIGTHTEEITYVATSNPNDASEMIGVDEPHSESLVINGSSIPVTNEVVTASGMEITNKSRNATAMSLSIRVPPPDRSGVIRTRLHIHRYPAVLPPETLRSLHAIHPLVARTVVTNIVMSPLYILYLLLIDGKRPLRPSQSYWIRKIRRKLVHL